MDVAGEASLILDFGAYGPVRAHFVLSAVTGHPDIQKVMVRDQQSVMDRDIIEELGETALTELAQQIVYKLKEGA